MKAKLIKRDDGYNLVIEQPQGRLLEATCSPSQQLILDKSGASTKHKLSKQNCDSLFGVIDVEKLADDYFKSTNENSVLWRRIDFKEGFKKAMALNKDKMFPRENMIWARDSGYTNFLESNKKWHRLVRNHLHFGRDFSAPVDRLNAFKIFPRQWRNDGDRILIIEPGVFSAAIFNIDIKKWKYNVEAELRNYTDKKIVFREKAPKKTRSPLYNYLLDEDFYCIVNINSNAATEAIWAGIPVITLDTHISNPVSKNKLSNINDLYRGSLAEWLCMLSYSQFTFEELNDGTASKIIKKYHG
jgi:hypothetical protein